MSLCISNLGDDFSMQFQFIVDFHVFFWISSFFGCVLARSRYVNGICDEQNPRFFVKIRDFEQFSWAQVQDFSKNNQFFERSRCIFAIFDGCSVIERVLARCR